MKLLTRLWERLRPRGSFVLVIREPFGGPIVEKRVRCTGRNLFSYLFGDHSWKKYGSALINGKTISSDWVFHIPRDGDKIDLLPGSGVKNFTEGFITRLNKEQAGGKFLKAIIVTESVSPLTLKYFVDNESSIVFNGNTYEPLSMSWQDFEVSREMNLPSMKITTPNIGGEVVDYVESIDILEHDVVLQLLHYDLLSDVNAKDELLLQIQAVEGDDMVAQFTLGLNLGFQDTLPRKVVLKTEYPGLTETYVRFRG